MNRGSYILGYTKQNLDWADTFQSYTNIVVYTDRALDIIRDVDDTNFYIITSTKIVNAGIVYTNDSITFQDVEMIIMSTDVVYIKGFLLLQRKKYLINEMVNSSCDNEFNRISNELNLDNWKYEFYHKKFLVNKMNRLVKNNTITGLCEIKRDHQMIKEFMEFVRNCFKVVNNRVFSFIVIGDTKIGKSVCFRNCLIEQDYIEYHNSMLEFSKCFDENKKLFRLMDDINWNTVDIMTLKTILNRNVATVDVKYSYGIIYPMINIFLMNKEDYVIFQKKYVDIWSFISSNVAIFPKQSDNNVVEETRELYDANAPFTTLLFDSVLRMKDWKDEFDAKINDGIKSNIYECVKSKLLETEPYVYDNKQFIDLTSLDISLLPNRQLIENEMLQRIKEVETRERYEEKVEKMQKAEKKPKRKTSVTKTESRKPRINDRNCLEYYFHRDKHRAGKPRKDRIMEDLSNLREDSSDTTYNDKFMDEEDALFGKGDNDNDDTENEMSMLNDSFIC